jgi:glycosyltransferase involved in cell wall biosynthesis
MDPVRLALDVGPLYGHRTGVGVAVAELHAALASHPGVDTYPYLLSFRTRPDPPTRRLPLPAAVAHRLWARADRPRVDRWLSPAEVVHGTNYVVPPSRLAQIVSVYDCWFLAHPEQASAAVRRSAAVLRRAAARGAWIHASSAATADRVRELLATDRVAVVHLGPLAVPAVRARPASAGWTRPLDGRPFLLALGTIERRKNVPALVEAFGRARSRIDGAALVLAGAPGDDQPAVEQALAELPPDVRDDVFTPGAVDSATKSWLLHHAAAVAYPSLDEGFGFPVLEAQAAGRPVVATRAGSIPEVAGDGAELVPLDDPDALAGALVRVIDDDARCRELVAAGRANLARFSWAATASGLVRLYRRLRDEGAP